jgi:uncharacterized protein YukE
MNLDYEKMHELYGNLTDVLNDLLENARNIRQIINSLESKEMWSGRSYNYYKSSFNKTYDTFLSLYDEIKRLILTILTSIENYKQVDRIIMQKLSAEGVS